MKKNKAEGVLPSQNWLFKKNKKALVWSMYRCPEAFSHISQNKLVKTSKYYIKFAKELIKEHGEIPCRKKLFKTPGGKAFYNYMIKHPKTFAYMEKEKKRKNKTSEDHINFAKELIKKYREIPCCSKLIKIYGKKGEAFYCYMLKNPKTFVHFEKERKNKTSEDHINFAKELIKKYREIPCCSKLIKMYGKKGEAFYCYMLRNPKIFTHFKKGKKENKASEKHIKFVNKLIKKHGEIPCRAKLIKIYGKKGMTFYYYIKKNPETFAHFKKERRNKNDL